MKYQEALTITQDVLEQLRPHCYRCEIAGSIRRKKEEVKGIEVVAIPKPYDFGLFESGIVTVVKRWEKIKGDFPCKYTQRVLPQGIKLDLFFADTRNWGYIYAIRTGNARYSHRRLACSWVKQGYKGVNGYLTKDGIIVPTFEERDFFDLIGVPHIAPEYRFY